VIIVRDGLSRDRLKEHPLQQLFSSSPLKERRTQGVRLINNF
jgi:hypothetical protein